MPRYMSWVKRVAPFDPVDAQVQHAVRDVRDQVLAPEIGCLGLRCAHER